jgi:hypothetical protein
MPLIKSKSKKAFSKNVEAEMSAGKPQPQALAIAYSVKRKAPKKMAEGGVISAKSEKRPMPDDRHDDAAMVSRNSGDKAPAKGDNARQDNISSQSKSVKRIQPMKHPKMAASPIIKARRMDEMDQAQDESRPNIEQEHHDSEEIDDQSIRQAQDLSHQEHPMDDMDQFNHVADDDVIEHAASIASAIMAKRRKFAEGGSVGEVNGADSIYSDDSDQADLSRNAEEDANMEDRSSFDALRKENYSESEGLRQLDYDDANLKGQEADDDHDQSIVSAIRRKMKSKSPITR